MTDTILERRAERFARLVALLGMAAILSGHVTGCTTARQDFHAAASATLGVLTVAAEHPEVVARDPVAAGGRYVRPLFESWKS